ncbi:cytochrome P450 [Streptomyces longisporoflavus]|uniref:cytochrome P450 family protein n=1 Tax=Streptomyces longisporoflavus TaxID=28044 RepID=UPI00167D7431|nr:cytochrome P450 [Streptomyces longisporoflavus]GGV73787.1 cytochrome P450 [Streptomyces longisporoflavus]
MTDPTGDPRPPRNRDAARAGTRSGCPVQPVPTGSGGRPAYTVTGYAEAREALSDARLSKDTAAYFAGKESRRRLHPALAQNMLASDPPRHTRLRKLVTGAFTTGAVRELRPFIGRVTEDLLHRWPVGERFDLVAGLAVPLPVIVICELLGVPPTDRADVRRWSAELFAAGEPDVIDAASHALAGYMRDLITAKRRAPGGTLLDRLIAARDGDDHLSEDELVSLAVLLLVAGHETTTNAIGNAVLALLQHPTELERLRRDPDAIASALDELLRFDSPVSTATFRFSTEAISLGGTDIPAGVPVLVALGEANRDPARFAAPGVLDLDREAAAHLGFGHGVHRCLGAPLARAEMEIALRAVLTRCPGIRLAVPAEELRRRRTRLVRGLVSLPVLA